MMFNEHATSAIKGITIFMSKNRARSGIARRAEPNPASPCKKEARKIMSKSNPYCSKMTYSLTQSIAARGHSVAQIPHPLQ